MVNNGVQREGMDSLVIRVDPVRRQWWKKSIQGLLPGLNIVLLDEDEYDPSEIKYAIVWNPPLGMFGRFPNLKCVASVGAGVSHILKDPDYPKHIPIIRCVSEALRMRMAEYLMLHVLRFHRRLPEVERAHSKKEWKQFIAPLANQMTIGIMGIGNLGEYAAKKFISMGYRVSGWSRREKKIDPVKSYFGDDQLGEFLSKVDILICTLPKTDLTENILSKATLSMLPKGSCLINVGRGECLDENALIDALDSNHLNGATLDVFINEPLPVDHPFWSHEKILVTCHSAGIIDPVIGGETIANNILKFINGEYIPDIVDMKQGY
jgi:glyoxylate/hydroxypyruvate reductase A